MNYKATIILEGGANRGVFTAGALHKLMDEDLYFTNIIGVSAGSCNGVDYASHQKTRSRDCFIITDKKNKWIHKKRLFSNKGLMDMEKLFVNFPKHTFTYDYDALYRYGLGCDVVVTNCITGKTEYFDFQKSNYDMISCRASCSMPFVGSMVFINDSPYMDGSVSNSVPLDRAYEIGNEKIVVVLTRQKEYRKSPNNGVIERFIKKKYRKYPEFIAAQLRRPEEYNQRLEELEELEKEGKIFVIRPEVTPVGRMEIDVEKLNFFYNHGYKLMERDLDNLKKYLEK